MKIFVVTDQHFGLSSNDPYNFDYMIRYYKEQVFPALLKHKIRHVVDMGDTFDSSAQLNSSLACKFNSEYLSFFEKNNIKLHTLVGNHSKDAFNSVKFKGFESFVLYESPRPLEIEGEELFAFPWGVSKDFNNGNFRDKIVFAHCTIRSMLANPERRIKGGIDSKFFSLARQVICGHIHTTSSLGNIYNIGSSHYLRWQDALHDEKRGGCLLDTQTGKMIKIINNFSRYIFINLVSGKTKSLRQIDKFSAVRVYLPLNSSLGKHESLAQKIHAADPSDLLVISDVRDYWLEAKRLLHDGFYASCGIICEYLFGCGVRSYEIEYMHAVARYHQGNYTGAYEKLVPHMPREAHARWLAEKCLKLIN